MVSSYRSVSSAAFSSLTQGVFSGDMSLAPAGFPRTAGGA